MITGNENASPQIIPLELDKTHGGAIHSEIRTGLTIRQQFAAMAMPGLICSPHFEIISAEGLAVEAVMIADALIAELNKPTAP